MLSFEIQPFWMEVDLVVPLRLPIPITLYLQEKNAPSQDLAHTVTLPVAVPTIDSERKHRWQPPAECLPRYEIGI
jgi:hypothetical protein